MAAINRRDSEERQNAVLNFFLADPNATGDEAQRALVSGKLTGKAGPAMGLGMLFALKRKAEGMARVNDTPN